MSRSLLRALLLWAAAVLAGCTDFVERTQVEVSIDAERALREHIRYVDVTVHSGLLSDNAWERQLMRQFLPRDTKAWPLSFTLPRPDREMGSGYLITATAKDVNNATLTVVRAMSAYVPGKAIELMLEFDKACVMREIPCPATFTCRDGQCVDSYVPPSSLPGAMTPGAPKGMPAAGSGGSDAAGGAAPGCVAGAGCASSMGCQADPQGCSPPPGCATRDDQGMCQACPVGFLSGPGDECIPVLRALAAEGGALEPAFDPAESDYVVHVPLLRERVRLTLEVPDAVECLVNGVALGRGEGWTSPNLPLGETSVMITLSAPGRKSHAYKLSVRREGAQLAQPTAAEAGRGDEFGRSLAVSGDRLVVGSPYEDGGAGSRAGMTDESAANSGAAYVFVRDGERWVQQAYLKSESPRPNARFGFYVALDGDQLAIAAPEDEGGGAIHMFEWDGGGFRGKGALRGDRGNLLFGRSIALQGDLLVVGAPGDDTGGTGTGSVYVFERSGSEWKRSQVLRPNDPAALTYFGSSVALDGDTIVSGATYRTLDSVPGGAAFVFTRGDAGWKELQMLRPMVSEVNAFFGESVSVSGATIAIGAFNGTAGFSGGSVNVFERGSDGKFGAPLLLRPTNSSPGDFFGGRVLVRGDTLLVGAPSEASAHGGLAANGGGMAKASGAVYLFSRERDGWRQLTQIKTQMPVADEEFGFGLAIQGDSFLVGAPGDPKRDGSGTGSGAFYVFR